MKLLADLHNHSCLSPCASLELSPSLLVAQAKSRGIGLLALTDHNSALNCPAFAQACERAHLAALFGIEVCSLEEVHVLVLFGDPEAAVDFGEWLRLQLPSLPYDPEKLGDQVVVDADENVLDLPDYFLGSAAGIGYDDICAEGHARGALVIPAHVDRPMFSVGSQLGFLPPGPYAAVESMREPARSLTLGYPVISGSDAHYPEHVGRRPFVLELATDSLAALPQAEIFALVSRALEASMVVPSWKR